MCCLYSTGDEDVTMRSCLDHAIDNKIKTVYK